MRRWKCEQNRGPLSRSRAAGGPVRDCSRALSCTVAVHESNSDLKRAKRAAAGGAPRCCSRRSPRRRQRPAAQPAAQLRRRTSSRDASRVRVVGGVDALRPVGLRHRARALRARAGSVSPCMPCRCASCRAAAGTAAAALRTSRPSTAAAQTSPRHRARSAQPWGTASDRVGANGVRVCMHPCRYFRP